MEFSLQELTSEVSMLKAKDKLAPPPGLDIQSSTNDDVQDVIVERISVLEKIFILVDWQQLEFTAQKLLKSQCLEPIQKSHPANRRSSLTRRAPGQVQNCSLTLASRRLCN